MTSQIKCIGDITRRQLMQRALGLAAAAAVAAPAIGQSVQPRRLQLRLEGDVPSLDWVLSLYTPPALAAGLPPGTAARFRVQYPAPDALSRDSPGHAVMAVSAFVAPAGVPPGVPAPELAPISSLLIAVEEVMLDIARFGEESTRPRKNVAIVGRIVANDVESPFGSLVGRVATTGFGFDWVNADEDRAVFKLVAISAAGSHVTVVPEAAGEIAFGEASLQRYVAGGVAR
jgi:hypothetical protein